MASRQGVWRLYAQGLRFDGAPGYDAVGGRIKPLVQSAPMTMVNDSLISLRAAVALLTGQMPRLEGKQLALEPSVMTQKLQRLLPDHSVNVGSQLDPTAALQLIQRGGVGVVAMRTPGRAPHWGVVVGCEGRWSGEVLPLTSARAILALDWTVPLVWGSGHNVRLERGLNVEGWTATTMEGGRWRVHVGPAVCVRGAEPSPVAMRW